MKAVFLIDTSVGVGTCEDANENLKNEILSVALRLLSFLSTRRSDGCSTKTTNHSTGTEQLQASPTGKGDKSPTNILCKWGFKYFSTDGPIIVRNKKLNGKATAFFENNHNVENFLNFENNTELILRDNDKVKTNTASKRTSLKYPSEQLTTALTEILHDFEWQDKNDLSKSPGRSLRKRSSLGKTAHREVQEQSNVLFILSKAPFSRQHLRRFSNKVVIDSDVFIDSFMSPALLEEYRVKSNISVFWIDFNCLEEDKDSSNEESLKIVKESLVKLGGDLLHKNDVLNEFSVPHFNHTPFLRDLCSTESILQHRLALLFPRLGKQIFSDCSPKRFISGSYELELGNAIVTSISHKKSDQVDRLETASGDARRSTLHNSPLEGFLLTNAKIKLSGCIPIQSGAEILSGLDLHQSNVLTCDNHSKISKVLGMLIKTQNHGVLMIRQVKDKTDFHMAVLSALTSTCGHIFILSQNQQLNLEKSVLFNAVKTDQYENTLPLPSESFAPPTNDRMKLNPQVWSSWHKAGNSQQLVDAIGNLKNRSRKCKGLSAAMVEVKGDMRKKYLKERRKQTTPVVKTQVQDTSLEKANGGSAESESNSSQARRLSRRSSRSLSRGRLLVERARSCSMLTGGDEENSSQSMKAASDSSRKGTGSNCFENINVTTEKELLSHLSKQYNQVMEAGVAIEASVQAMVTFTCFFMSTQQKANPQKSAVLFIHKNLSLDTAKLKEKYINTDNVDKKVQVAEYKLQLLLLLAMASCGTDVEVLQGDQLISALTSMTRALSFISGPSNVREFISTATESYCGTLTYVLKEVFDELDLPYPQALAELTSPSAPSTVWGLPSVDSVGSILSGPSSSQPGSSNRNIALGKRNGLKHHPSISDFRQKKQILVEKPKPKQVSKTDRKRSAKDKGKQKSRSAKTTRQGVDYGRAKRNLFSDKSKSAKSNKESRLQLTPKRKSGKPKLLVPGTPAHKQTSERILSRQKRLRDHLNIKPEVQVVAESPFKDEVGTSMDNRSAKLILQESFYSSNASQSRIVAKSRELEEKGEGSQKFLQPSRSQGSLISAVRGESPLISPRTSMMRSFMSSPTSQMKCDKKKNTDTPKSHLRRRSPRKSVKKLLFQNAASPKKTKEHGSSSKQSKMQNNLDARLVFDGENASHALVCDSPMKNRVYREGYKTPEKRDRDHSAQDLWESSSCPSLQFTPVKSKGRKQVKTPELNFKNCFNNIVEKDDVSRFRENKQETVFNVIGKDSGFQKSNSKHFDTDQQKSNAKLSGSSKTKRHTSAAQSKNISHRKSDAFSFDSKQSKTDMKRRRTADDCEPNLSTPKKCKTTAFPNGLSTPGKVHFSDLDLISPPSGAGRPLPITPQRSILKNSPAFKHQSFSQRLEFSGASVSLTKLSLPEVKNPTSFGSPKTGISKQSLCYSVVSGNEKLSTQPFQHEKDRIKKSITDQFDQDSSSSNSSPHVPASENESRVVTSHSPSPSSKSKTPESINKWMRKKRHSGNRTVSSSSSSSSVSPSSYSNDCKDKVSQKLCGKVKSVENIALTNKDKEDSANLTVSNSSNLKRILFSTNNSITESITGVKRIKSRDSNFEQKSKKSPCKSKKVLRDSTMSQIRSFNLASHTSGGFSHSSTDKSLQLEVQSTGLEEKLICKSNPSILNSSTSKPIHSPNIKHHPLSKSNMMLKTVLKSSSFTGDGSQGFSVDLNCENDISQEHKSPQDNHPSSLSSDSTNSSSRTPVSKPPTPKKQFSPALSTSGLLQLIQSPLLEKHTAKTLLSHLPTRSKSRKQLDWPKDDTKQ